jgi:hypothetical protein
MAFLLELTCLDRQSHNEEMKMTVREWLPLQRSDLCRGFLTRLIATNALMFWESCVEK